MAPSIREDAACGGDKGGEMEEERDWSGSLQIRGFGFTSLAFCPVVAPAVQSGPQKFWGQLKIKLLCSLPGEGAGRCSRNPCWCSSRWIFLIVVHDTSLKFFFLT